MVLNWGFGVLFLLVGLASLVDSQLTGLPLIVLSLLLLPPVRKFAYAKTNQEVSIKVRSVLIFSLLIVFTVFVGQEGKQKTARIAEQEAQEVAELTAQLEKANVENFVANKESIILSAKASLSAKDYQSVISQTNDYIVSGDEELKSINLLAKTELLLAELKTIPSSEFEKNKEYYQQLVNLHPENKKYKNKVAAYSIKIEEARKAELEKAARTEKIEAQFSPWDGSHRNLERLIKKAMNDPDSYEHDKTRYWDKGDHLIVRTDYRGRNGFGGMVRGHAEVKTTLNGEIIQIISNK